MGRGVKERLERLERELGMAGPRLRVRLTRRDAEGREVVHVIEWPPLPAEKRREHGCGIVGCVGEAPKGAEGPGK